MRDKFIVGVNTKLTIAEGERLTRMVTYSGRTKAEILRMAFSALGETDPRLGEAIHSTVPAS